MKINKRVPFYPNPDKTHCFQTALRMIMKYFWPDKDFSWKELERITAKVEGLWTWPMAGLLWLQKRGFDIRKITVFDYKKFVRLGGRYLIDKYGKEVGEDQIKNSDIKQERKIAKEFIKQITIEKRIPTMVDLKNLLRKGYLILCNVNSRKLNNKEGYSGHFVVVKGFNNKHLIIHDPGPTHTSKNRLVDFDLFKGAWAYPNAKAKDIIALKFLKDR